MKFLTHKIFVATFLISFFSACETEVPDDDDDTTITDSVLILHTTHDSLMLWSNTGNRIFLNSGYIPQSYTRPGSMIYTAADSTLYIAGWENNKAVLYKNNIKTILHNQYSAAGCINVSGNDIYIGGFTMDNNGSNLGDTYMTYWKNGIRNTNYIRNSFCNAILKNGSDFYWGGSEITSGYRGNAVFYKNNTPITLTSINAEVNSIAAKNNDIYVAGTTFFNSSSEATLWINGVEQFINGNTTTNSTANTVYIDGNDVYVCGSIGGAPGYWKNGNPVFLDVHSAGTAWDIKVKNGNVHVVGSHYNVFSRLTVAAYWKNGKLTELNSDNGISEAMSIIVK